jgi:hypothetical protein
MSRFLEIAENVGIALSVGAVLAALWIGLAAIVVMLTS